MSIEPLSLSLLSGHQEGVICLANGKSFSNDFVFICNADGATKVLFFELNGSPSRSLYTHGNDTSTFTFKCDKLQGMEIFSALLHTQDITSTRVQAMMLLQPYNSSAFQNQSLTVQCVAGIGNEQKFSKSKNKILQFSGMV